jgi:hypothetical protein
MVDDGNFAKCIIGIGENVNKKVILCIADPHITKSDDKYEHAGIYTLTLDDKGVLDEKSCNVSSN